MPDASLSDKSPFRAATPFGWKMRTAALLGLVLAVTQPANALEGVRGGFGGVQGWGGLYRDNRDVGYFPAYVAYGDVIVVEWTHPRSHSLVARHRLRRHHAGAYHCAPRPVRHCICC
jgi:hypothetical protein